MQILSLIPIQTKRLTVRRFIEGDLEKFYEYTSDIKLQK
jgi:hypothetical protein